MPLTRPWMRVGGGLVLAAVWFWPLPGMDWPPFTRHMAMHMAVVALAAPLLALGIAGGPFDPSSRWPRCFSAVLASVIELVAVWAWHAPKLHHLARHQAWAFTLEQGTFLGAGLFLWVSALGGPANLRRARSVAGVAGLLLTSMHMTLLGALIALSPRVLYHHATHGSLADPLLDQRVGGAVMLFVGAAAYLAGGVALMRDALRQGASTLDPRP
jgi:putative membrane protein